MDSSARVTSKGQVTIPKAVRDALQLHEGDQLLFRVEHNRAILANPGRRLLLARSSERGQPLGVGSSGQGGCPVRCRASAAVRGVMLRRR